MSSKFTTWKIFALAVSAILLSACATETATLAAIGRTPTFPSASLTTPSTPTPTIHLPATDEVILTIPNPQPFFGQEGESPADFWMRACQALLCLPVLNITEGEQVGENEFRFFVEFIGEDGRRFEMGACCGADPAEALPVWQFAFPVKKINGEWKVTRGPLFMP